MVDGFSVDYIGGVCPVEAEGSIDGHRFYFSARGDVWQLQIGGADPSEGADWSYSESYGVTKSAAGFIKPDEARALIRKAILIFRSETET